MHTFTRLLKNLTIHQWILIGILVCASFIRLYQSTQYIPFWEEQVDDMIAIRSTWHNLSTGNVQGLSLKGQSGTYRSSYLPPGQLTPVYHGVAYYYVLLPAAVLSKFNPYGVVLFLIALGLISVYLLYDVGVLLFKDKAVGLVAAFLGASSFWMSAYSRWIWTPSMMPFFTLLAFSSFFRVISGKTNWWYPLVFSLSLGSQMHDSGYVPLVFFLVATLLYRPPLPSTWWKKGMLVFLGLLPIAPTVINEVLEGFHMTRSLALVAYHALPTFAALGTSFLRFVVNAFGVTIMNLSYIESIIAHGWVVLGVFALVCFAVWREHTMRNVKKRSYPSLLDRPNFPSSFIASWWLICLVMSVFIEYLYADQVLNDYSRMNNLAFTLPMIFLCGAFLIVELWRRYSKVISISILCIFVSLNILTIRDYLWSYTERDWAYGDLVKVSWLIPHIAGEEPYDLVVYRYQEGSYESKNVFVMLYFIELYPARMPERFNGSIHWALSKQELRGREAHQQIIVMDKRYVGFRELPKSAQLIDQTQGYYVYKVVN